MKTELNFEKFVQAYIAAALWSSTDEAGDPLDDSHSPDDIAPETLQQMREDCRDFFDGMQKDLQEYCEATDSEEWSGESCAGHDYWLTRNGHGAGFWDRGLGALGQRLSDAAKVYRGFDLYIGDDGKIYGQ